MMRILSLALAAIAVVAAPLAAQTVPLPADQAAMKAHVMFLASDAMRGREAGSGEFDIAAQYVAAQFYAAGLRPMGDDGGYLQAVKLLGYKAAGEGTLTWTPAGGTARALAFGSDYVPAADPAAKTTHASAPVVFVGHGLEAPAYGLDAYRGVDVRGKIVAYVGGAPDGLPSEVAATFGGAEARLRAAAAHGAVGAIALADLRAAARGAPAFDAVKRAFAGERVTWATPAGVGGGAEAIPLLATLSPTGTAKLFGARWNAVRTAAQTKGRGVTAIAAPGVLAVDTATTLRPFASSNVVGMLPGSDPALAKEVVVLSAHLDHVGVGTPVDGDAIYNGALDDAIGIASLIEEAKRFKAAGTAPKRSILFLAVTAEEKGLIGSDWFVHHPPVPIADMVADVNLDMPVLTYPFEDMIAFGGDRSTLGPIIARATAALGVTLSPDPIPEMSIFVRSDHYNFVRKGVPSIFLWPGLKGPGKAAFEAFMSRCYHRPCDDLSQPIRWDQGVRFVDANYRIAREIADAADRPRWNKGDYFGTLYGGPMGR
ncbi:M28 family peptidase [Sphingomonas adhaesiva]|uniref:M28 family peptidase n=1 Tax=Sphingomonas adhaesiva TaxID=28212 RepID=UPI002FFC91A5